MRILPVLIGALLFPCAFSAAPAAATARPDVLFIAFDDLNDWIPLLDPSSPIRMPHLDRLAARGVTFTRAYCESPACNPSRTAVLTGRASYRTGVYGNTTDWRRALPGVPTLPAWFKRHGYRTEGAGKIYHHHGLAFAEPEAFDHFQSLPELPDAPMPGAKLNGLSGYGTANTDWGVWPADETTAVDHRTADYAISALRRPRAAGDAARFLAVGFFRPHMPFFAPASAFAEYAGRPVALPRVKADDTVDLPAGAQGMLQETSRFWSGLAAAEAARPGTWADAVRAYQASATWADRQLGRVLDALEASGRADRTVIVVWSDHGYHLGEKQHWEKFALWEKTTHVPLIVVAPGLTPRGARCDRPVSLLDVFPTLAEIASLPAPAGLDGRSLVALLRDPKVSWPYPAIMTHGPGNHAVRDERWRYIRYADGTEELYDHANDPDEWTNLAGRSDATDVVVRLKKWIPTKSAPAAPNVPRPAKRKQG